MSRDVASFSAVPEKARDKRFPSVLRAICTSSSRIATSSRELRLLTASLVAGGSAERSSSMYAIARPLRACCSLRLRRGPLRAVVNNASAVDAYDADAPLEHWDAVYRYRFQGNGSIDAPGYRCSKRQWRRRHRERELDVGACH